jgi:hypothetical protein
MAPKTSNNFVYGRGFEAADGSDTAFLPLSGYAFATGIVTDCITGSGKKFLKEKFEINSRFINEVKNIHMLNKLAPNSIIVAILDNARSIERPERYVALPFFSPHISMPIKPGEYVWLMIESDNDKEVVYWMSRKHGIGQVDDVNYTFLERTDSIENTLVEKIKSNTLNKKKESEINDPSIVKNETQNMHSFLSNQLIDVNTRNDLLTNASIIDNSHAKSRIKREVVPKKSKNPGDLLLQGSNNSHIQLTTEKFAGELHELASYSPAIDICIGRKKAEIQSIHDQWFGTEDSPGVKDSETIVNANTENETFISAVSPLIEAIADDKTALELNKTKDTFEDLENEKDYYDNDPLNCGGRLYLSKNCKIDDLFGLGIDDMSSYEGASIVTYSDHNRVVGDQTVRIVNKAGESFIDLNELGDIVLKSSIEDGQQFLSLANASDGKGISRLQARDEIHLAVRSDNTIPSEPYVLYSELRDLLDKITGDISFINILLEDVIMKGILSPFGGPAIMETFETLRSAAPQSGIIEVEIPPAPESEDEPEIITVSTTFLGGNITTEKMEEWGEILNTKMKSTKIFGEANDE